MPITSISLILGEINIRDGKFINDVENIPEKRGNAKRDRKGKENMENTEKCRSEKKEVDKSPSLHYNTSCVCLRGTLRAKGRRDYVG